MLHINGSCNPLLEFLNLGAEDEVLRLEHPGYRSIDVGFDLVVLRAEIKKREFAGAASASIVCDLVG